MYLTNTLNIRADAIASFFEVSSVSILSCSTPRTSSIST